MKNKQLLSCLNLPDSTPINDFQNREIFLMFGKIDTSSIEDIYYVKGIGSGLANRNGIYFAQYMGNVVKTLGDLKSLYKFATGKDLTSINE